jgi:hypothetical protein
MTSTQLYRRVILFLFPILIGYNALSCSCLPAATQEEEYKRSALVVQGRIVCIDTINSSNSLIHNKRGVKEGRHKYFLSTEAFIRAKVVVERNFKPGTSLPDTIFVLTPLGSAACGYPFEPYLDIIEQIDPSYYKFIIYGDRWTEKIIEEIKTKKHPKKVIRTIEHDNIFYTARCRRTRHLDKDELQKLEKSKS